MRLPGRDPARRTLSTGRPRPRRWVTVDLVTGTLHREALERRIVRLAAGGSVGTPTADAACVLFDVVGLKAVNAAAGFSAGDSMLGRAAATVRSACRDAAMIGRLGGDELLALFTGPDASRRAAAAADAAARATDPPLRSAWSEVIPGESPARLFDRLYAACRGDRRAEGEGG